MPIAGNPKKLAYSVAQGYQQFTQSTLRAYTPEELKILSFNLNVVLREVRGTHVPLEDMENLKDKNVKIRRLNQAISTIHSFAALKGIRL
jgi:predicted double-glycine peptidase